MANYKKWSDSEKNFIRISSINMSDKEIAQKMSELSGENITDSMIRQQRRKLKAIKSKGRPRKNSVTPQS